MDEQSKNAAAILGRKGGQARAESLTPRKRKAIAKKAAIARWANEKRKNAAK